MALGLLHFYFHYANHEPSPVIDQSLAHTETDLT
jgi:hypothetical protein